MGDGALHPQPGKPTNPGPCSERRFLRTRRTASGAPSVPGTRWKTAALVLGGLCVLLAVLLLTILWVQAHSDGTDSGQAVSDGQEFALFVLDISEDLMGHLNILLECSGYTATETLNIAASLG